MTQSKKKLTLDLHRRVQNQMNALGFTKSTKQGGRYFKSLHDDWCANVGFSESNIDPSNGGRELLPIGGLQHQPTVELMTKKLGYGRPLPLVAGNIGYLLGKSHASLIALSESDIDQVATEIARLIPPFLDWARKNIGATQIDQIQSYGIYCPDRDFIEPAFFAATSRIPEALKALKQSEGKVLAPGGVRAEAFVEYSKKFHEWALRQQYGNQSQPQI